MFAKDPTDARWKDDPGFKEYAAFMAKYMSPAEFIDAFAVTAFGGAAMLIPVLKQCGDDLSRENIMRQAANLKDLELPMLLPGIKVNTSPDNYYPIRQMQLASFNGESWEQFGDVPPRPKMTSVVDGPMSPDRSRKGFLDLGKLSHGVTPLRAGRENGARTSTEVKRRSEEVACRTTFKQSRAPSHLICNSCR